MGEAECKYMFKNIERKQKLIDEKNRTKEKVQSSQMLFSSGFIRELNQISTDKFNDDSNVSVTAKHTQESLIQSNKL